MTEKQGSIVSGIAPARQRGLWLIVLLTVVLGSWPPAAGATQPHQQGIVDDPIKRALGSSPGQNAVSADVQKLQSSEWWAQAQAYIQQREYTITAQETPGTSSGYRAPNRAHDLRFTFDADGLQAMRRTETKPSWTWGLALAALGQKAATPTIAAPVLTVDENRIVYERGSLWEQYTNDENGLTQLLTVPARPVGDSSAPLLLEMHLSGDLNARQVADDTLEFRQGASPVLGYGDLHATDATGRALPARFSLPTPAAPFHAPSSTLQIIVDDAGARYPLHVQARVTGVPTQPDWHVEGAQVDAYMGFSVATAGDVNGDGYSDVIVGAKGYSGQHNDNGAAFVFHGSPLGLTTTANWSAEGQTADATFGWAVATAGDVNGDGFSDVIVGAPHQAITDAEQGRAFVYLGSDAGLKVDPEWYAEGTQFQEHLGISVGTAGDVNGDGFSDIIIGVPNHSAPEKHEGRACVWYGGGTPLFHGVVGTPGNADWHAESDKADAVLGWPVATAGDVNGDGYSDVIVGAELYAHEHKGQGRAWVYHGSDTGLDTTAAWIADGDQENANFGSSVATAGDVNGDGYSDVIVGARGHTSGVMYDGAVYVYHGSSSGLNMTANWTVIGNDIPYVGMEMGGSVATAGDVNGDGYADVLVGASFHTVNIYHEGGAFLWYGSSQGVGGGVEGRPYNADWATLGGVESAHYGCSVATAGDVNGDGYSDILIGAANYEADLAGEGVAFAFYGGPDNLNTTAGWATESDVQDAYLGYSVATAGDVDGDGYAEVIVGAPGYDGGSGAEGAAFVWFSDVLTPLHLRGNQALAQFGYSVGCAGDVNGDGYGDVIVGAPYYMNDESEEGRVFVWYGSSDGQLQDSANWTAESNQATAHLGWSVGTAGDVNGDGYSDIAAGAPTYTDASIAEGTVLVWHGDASGLGDSGTPDNADWHREGGSIGALLGRSVATAGDVNRDGYSDLIAGGNNFATAWHGSSSGLPDSGYNWLTSGSGSYGWSVATAGDTDGDGYSEVIVGAPNYTYWYEEEGGAWIYPGSSSGLDTTSVLGELGWQAYARLGWSVGTAGDVNGDGYAEIVMGAPTYTNGQDSEGQVRLYYGSELGPDIFDYWFQESDMANANLGVSVATAGDVNGDGYADLLLGAPYYANNQDLEGQASIFYGNGRPGVPLLPRQLRTDGVTPIAPLGRSNAQNSFKLQARGHSPTGRGLVRQVREVKPLDTAFTGFDVVQAASSYDSGGKIGVQTVTETALGLTPNSPYHWRVRLGYDLVTNPFNPPYSRWLHMPWSGWNENDLRTAEAGTNQPPNQPSNPSPADGASGVALSATLTWEGGDPDGDTVIYTVYGTVEGSGFSLPWCQGTSLSCPIGPMVPGTRYLWQVEADDQKGGFAQSKQWAFTTTGRTQAKEKVYLPFVRRNR